MASRDRLDKTLRRDDDRPVARGQTASPGACRFLGVVAAAGLECRKPAAEAGELIWPQLGDGLRRFLPLSCGEYTTAGGLVEPWKGIWALIERERLIFSHPQF
jgi:hypothetical protein